ncbi:MAG: hypothetical protein IJW59_04140 [Clostridia bacterium]|nr:hypothetical protein [Clostridia bacterium]
MSNEVNYKENENSYFQYLGHKASVLQTSKSLFVIFVILFIDIISLALSWIFVGNRSGNALFSDVLNSINENLLLLIILMGAVGYFVKSFFDYLVLVKRTKQKKYFAILSSNIRSDFFNHCTIGFNNAEAVKMSRLCESSVADSISMEITFAEKISAKIFRLMYMFVGLVAFGAFFINMVPLWIYIVSIVAYIFNFVSMLPYLLFNKHREKIIEFCAKIIKILYSLRLIKDYELCFRNTIDKLYLYSSSLKRNKRALWFGIIKCFVSDVIECLVIYFSISLLNFGGGKIIISVLLSYVVFKSINTCFDWCGSVLIYELMYLLIFETLYCSGYVVWGLILSRFVEFYMVVVIYLIELLLSKIFISKKRVS